MRGINLSGMQWCGSWKQSIDSCLDPEKYLLICGPAETLASICRALRRDKLFGGVALRLDTRTAARLRVCKHTHTLLAPVSAVRCALSREALSRRSYQLEEMEDSANQTSAIYLRDDGVVTLGETDGPAPDKSQGSWNYDEEDGLLTLELVRWFGNDAVPFSVKRILKGHPENNRESLPLFQGAMFREPTDFTSEEALGHFALVQAIDDLPQEDYDITQG